MFPIVKKRVLNPTVTLMEIEAPLVARKALPGQFIIFRIDEEGERIPLTIAGYDREKGTVTIIFQKVGYTTEKLDTLNEGDALLDFVGPLGEPSHTEGVKRAAVIGGGLGVAIAYPQAKALHEAGCEVDLIVGFRNEDLIILKDELTAACTELTVMTDDGSNGNKGFVTQALQAKLDEAAKTEEGRAELQRQLDEFKAEADSAKTDLALERAGCTDPKKADAARALLADYGGDVASLKADHPYLFDDKQQRQTGTTGGKPGGAPDPSDERRQKARRAAGLVK